MKHINGGGEICDSLVSEVSHTYIYIYIYTHTLLANLTGWVLGKKGYYFLMKKKMILK